jgi:superfamily I DNA/RNA helicase
MTTFGAKGLEFNTVVMPYFDSELAPYSPRGQTIDWFEERRKLYVAITRTRYRVIFAFTGQPSRFIGELGSVLEPWSSIRAREADEVPDATLGPYART